MKVYVIGLIGTAVAAAAMFVWSTQGNASEADDLRQSIRQLTRAQERDSERIEQARDEAALTRRLLLAARTPQDTQKPAVQPVTTDAEPARPPELAAEREPESSIPGSAPLELVVSNMEAIFETELVEPSVAKRAVSEVQHGIQPLLGEGASIASLECRTTMCRLTSVQKDLDQYRKFVSEVTHTDVCKECFFTQSGETADGQPVLTLYMARGNNPLPRVE